MASPWIGWARATYTGMGGTKSARKYRSTSEVAITVQYDPSIYLCGPGDRSDVVLTYS